MTGSVVRLLKNNPMQKLSVAIITFNEAANIAACIQSVKDIADEIIVVDSLSTDKTTEIASKLGAKIIPQKFLGHIEQKNLALQACTHSYVLSIDADERLDEQTLESIRIEKERGFPCDGYFFKRLTFIGETPVKKGSWYPDKKLRLVKKEIAEWKGINPHDTLKLKNANTSTLQGNILHYSFSDRKDVMEKTRKYARISAIQLHSMKKSIPLWLLYIKSMARWFKHLFLKGGIFDFRNGWFLAKQQYMDAWWKYKELRELNKAKGKN
jgi:glycosyltransferase involved in cell wall biosynthesis